MLEIPIDTNKSGGMSSGRERRNSVPKGIGPGNKSNPPDNGGAGGRMSYMRACMEDKNRLSFVNRSHGCQADSDSFDNM